MSIESPDHDNHPHSPADLPEMWAPLASPPAAAADQVPGLQQSVLEQAEAKAPEATNMIYGSVCSGIEAASVAWQPLGWQPRWFAEINPFCCALLTHRYPAIPNLGDLNDVKEDQGPIDLLVGGTPCQSFSVNAKRQGFHDPRGNLTLLYGRLLQLLRPAWFVWENVPGIISLDSGRSFTYFLHLVGQCGYGWAYRLLDAQHFGVPQRRRRLFLVGRAGGRAQQAAAVLFDQPTETRNVASSRPSRPHHDRGHPPSLRDNIFGWTGDPTPKICRGLIPTLRSQQGGEGTGFARDGIVSRLTPREMERTMGLPDDYTLVPFQGKPASDRARSRALGNSFAVPVLFWIGQRLDFVNSLPTKGTP